jgi:predicted tellurium resistance membrane protein TerC
MIPYLTLDASGIAALVSLTVMEIVLGVDNLVFVAVLSNTLPVTFRVKARSIGLLLALGFRIVLLASLVALTHLTEPVVAAFGRTFSTRDLILIAGGLFLVWKSTSEIHGQVTPKREREAGSSRERGAGGFSFAWAILQILVLDLVFSVDSILTAVGMTDRLPIMVAAVIIAVGLMLVASGPLAAFIRKRPSVVLLALSFLLLIGAILIADGFGEHVPRTYIYVAMGFAGFVEVLNLVARRRPKPEGK